MPPIDQQADPYADLDTAAIAADIGSELFSKAAEKPGAEIPGFTESEVVDPAAAPAPAPAPNAAAPAVDPAAPAVIPGENSVGKPLPKSWKKELSPEWEKLSPAVREYVHEREAQVMRGINQYQQGYTAWDNLIKPFAPVLEANPEVNPIVLMQGLMATHLQLLSPSVPAAEKQKLVNGLLANYGISLVPSDGSNPQPPAVDPVLLQRLAASEAKIAGWERNQREQGIQGFKAQVDEFSAKPENEYFGEVSADILHFIQTRTVSSLQEAYDLACWANPAVRAKMLAKQQAAAPAPAPLPRKQNGQFRNLEGDTDVKTKPKVGTIDQTIDAIVAKAYTKH